MSCSASELGADLAAPSSLPAIAIRLVSWLRVAAGAVAAETAELEALGYRVKPLVPIIEDGDTVAVMVIGERGS